MGINLALEAASRGAEVTLLLGPTTEKVPDIGLNIIPFESTQDLVQQVDRLSAIDIFISAAAIGDYELDKTPGKIPSKKETLTLALKPSTKVIDHVHQKFPKAKIIGFKAEVDLTKEELITKAQTSLKEHNIEMVIANLVNKPNQGFASETNTVIVISKNTKPIEISLLSKRELSREIFNLIKQIK